MNFVIYITCSHACTHTHVHWIYNYVTFKQYGYWLACYLVFSIRILMIHVSLCLYHHITITVVGKL